MTLKKNGRLCSLERLNLFFKIILVLGMLAFTRAHAINVHALYTASCQREVGIILSVTPRQVLLLNLKGQIVSVERFEVIYYASYPLDTVPVAAVQNPQEVPLVEIKTIQDAHLVSLVRGWPVDFSKDKIAFLSLRGTELMIDRTSIWKVIYDSESERVEFQTRPSARYEFVHPYAFSSCTAETSGGGTKYVKVTPQQLLSDPVSIKREFDRLAEGHTQIHHYESDQQFYAVPELYSNETTLGLWISTGSRYGASQNRQSNFAPLLINQRSEGPFGFQSEFRTGSGPLMQSIHEEPQTQAYYRMKADYFHFSGFVDPSLLLVGSKYHWFAKDMNSHEIRANESATLEFGFDYGKIALEFFLGGAVSMGARDEAYFQRSTMSAPRLGLRYQAFTWIADFQFGSGSKDGFDLSFWRANLELTPTRNTRWAISAIKKDMDFDGKSEDAQPVYFKVRTESTTLAAYSYRRFKGRYWVGAFISAEQFKKKFGENLEENGSDFFPKVGGMLSLSF